jgi:hypothetical protein
MTDIKPALTAEEWAERRTSGCVQATPDVAGPPADHWHRILAITNDILPDDDPRKIVRADVAICERVLWEWAAHYATSRDDIDAQYAALHSLIAKLNALLPPEPE